MFQTFPIAKLQAPKGSRGPSLRILKVLTNNQSFRSRNFCLRKMPGSVLLQWLGGEHDEDLKWKTELQHLLPDRAVKFWRCIDGFSQLKGMPEDFEDVEYAVVWTMPTTELAKLPRLRAVLLLGAGADQLKDIHHIPPQVPIVRLVDDDVARSMTDYAVHWVSHFHFGFDEYARLQRSRKWLQGPPRVPRNKFTVGVMGMGFIGKAISDGLLAVGYSVIGWSRSGRSYNTIPVFSQQQIDSFLNQCNAVVNVLPLTKQTHRILNASRLENLPPNAIIINIGRGGTIEAPALSDALTNGHLRAAVLDVFDEEPLTPNSPYWSNEKVIVTPHVSGSSFAQTGAKYVVQNILRIERGEEPFPVLDREKQY